MKRQLYQKNHGLPGVAMTGGLRGKDGNSGNNIYIGYINDFFENTEIVVDNLVRVAVRNSSFYTGVYATSSLANALQHLEEYASYDPVGVFNTSANLYHGMSDMFDIKVDSRDSVPSQEEFYDDLYEDEKSDSLTYVKVDFNGIGKDVSGNDSSWNRSYAPWKESLDCSRLDYFDGSLSSIVLASDTSYPYEKPKVYYDDSVLIRPGKNVNRNAQGFDLFSVADNGHSYTFSDSEKSLRWDSSVFPNIKDSSAHNIGDPTIDEIVSWDKGLVDEIKVDLLKTKSAITETIYVADHLSSSIKEGDIIYFYTDKEQFEVDNIIHYMVYITAELEGCDLQTLVNAACVTDPFTFKYVSDTTIDGIDYVYTISNVVSGFYKTTKTVDSSYVNAYGSNFTKLLSYMSNSAINLGIISDLDTSVIQKTDGEELYNEEQSNDNELIHMRSYVDSSAYGYMTFTAEHKDEIGQVSVNPKFVNTDSSVSIPLKIKNMFIKKENNGNIEAMDTLNPEHIFTNTSGHAYTITEENYNEKTNVVLVTNDLILNDVDFDDFECGFNILCFKKTDAADSHLASNAKMLYFTPSMRKSVVLKKEYGNDTCYDILFWIRETGGVTLYSDHTIFQYNADYSKYEIVSGLSPEKEEETDVAIFETSGISADANSSVFTDIYLPKEIDKQSVRVFINSTEIDMNQPVYESSWYSVNAIYTSTESPKSDYKLFRIEGSAKSNLPAMGSAGDVMSTVQEYIKYAGSENSEVSGCDLFNNLLNGVSNNTTERNATITVVYVYNNEERKSFYKLTQPGYTEKRHLPKVDLVLHKDIEFLENANKVENGVLSNQFQFFVDINISDFRRDCWGSYVSDSSISMDLEIKNSLYDYDIIKKYSIQNAQKMSTLHINNNVSDYNPDKADFEDSSNYVRIKTTVINNTISDVRECNQSELYNASVPNSVVTTSQNEYVNISAYSFITKSETLDSGIAEDITIKLNNIKFSDISDGRKYRICVNLEFGNPLFAKLFFKFYVSNIVIKYDDGKQPDPYKFYVGTDNLAALQQTGTMNYYDYLYSSNTLNAFICPISYTASPREYRAESYTDEKQKQIYMSLSKYVPDSYTLSDGQQMKVGADLTNAERNSLFISQHVNWFDFKLYKSYFLDNIQTMNISPIDVIGLRNLVSPDNLFYKSTDFDKIDTVRRNKNYMSVVYTNSGLYDIRKEEDSKIFPYPINPESERENLYASRYAQYENRAPIYTEQHYAYEIRNTKLSNSVRMWNKESQQYVSYNSKLFDGHFSAYGNGYMFLDDVLDEGQYKSFDIYSLTETKENNSEKVLVEKDAKEFVEPDLFRVTQPLDKRWYDSLLLQLKWQYPKYYQNTSNHDEFIDAYDLIRCGEYRQLENGVDKFKLPYNLAYTIYPRCAYDYDNDNVVVFMLRCPSILNENNYRFGQGDTITGMYGEVSNSKQNVAK